MSEWFHVGQKVVCTKEGGWLMLEAGETGPRNGRVYTIRTISRNLHDGELYLRFEEILNPEVDYAYPPDDGINECRFWAKHFRPLRKRSTDLSIFKAMLSPKKQEVEA